MGGHAFDRYLGPNATPRMPSEIYAKCKEAMKKRLYNLFQLVAVPKEGLGKIDYGDIDLVVYGQKRINLTCDDIMTCLGAIYINPPNDPDLYSRTNYAIPKSTVIGGTEGLFQVDLVVCKDKEEWYMEMFFGGYADLGPILAEIARLHDFQLTSKGLAVEVRGTHR